MMMSLHHVTSDVITAFFLKSRHDEVEQKVQDEDKSCIVSAILKFFYFLLYYLSETRTTVGGA